MSNENICLSNADQQHTTTLDVDYLEEMVRKGIHPNRHKLPMRCFDCGQTVTVSTHAFDTGAIQWSGINQPMFEARAGDTEDEILTQIALQLGYPPDWDSPADMLDIMARLITQVRPHPGVFSGEKYLARLREAGLFIDPEWIPRTDE